MEQSGEIKSVADFTEKFAVLIKSDEVGEREVVPAVQSYNMQLLTNMHGVLQVGDKIIQIKDDWKYTASIEHVSDFTDITQVHKVKKERLNIQSFEKVKELEGLCTVNYVYGGSDHRLKPRWYKEQFSTGGMQFMNWIIEIKHQKKGAFGIWYANAEDEIGYSGDFVLATSGFGDTLSFSSSHTVFNTSQLNRNIHTGPYSNADPGQPEMGFLSGSEADHWSEDAGVSPRPECTISL